MAVFLSFFFCVVFPGFAQFYFGIRQLTRATRAISVFDLGELGGQFTIQQLPFFLVFLCFVLLFPILLEILLTFFWRQTTRATSWGN